MTFLSNFAKRTDWNVAENDVNVVVVDELISQITVYSCLTIDIWTRMHGVDKHQHDCCMRFGAIHPKWRASSEIGVKSFRL